MNYLFDEKLIAALRIFGWYPERKVEINQISSGWKKDGYRVFPEASKFVKSFGGLTLTYPAYGGGALAEGHFDPSVATRRIDRSWIVEDYEPLANESLLPVGQGYSGHLTFLIGDRGGFYGGYDDYFCTIGKSVEDALEKIFFGGSFGKLSE